MLFALGALKAMREVQKDDELKDVYLLSFVDDVNGLLEARGAVAVATKVDKVVTKLAKQATARSDLRGFPRRCCSNTGLLLGTTGSRCSVIDAMNVFVGQAINTGAYLNVCTYFPDVANRGPCQPTYKALNEAASSSPVLEIADMAGLYILQAPPSPCWCTRTGGGLLSSALARGWPKSGNWAAASPAGASASTVSHSSPASVRLRLDMRKEQGTPLPVCTCGPNERGGSQRGREWQHNAHRFSSL